MGRSLSLALIGLFFGIGVGVLLATEPEPHDHGSHAADHAEDSDHAAMHANLTEVDAEGAPKLQLTLRPDGPSSRNLHIGTTNFLFSAKDVNRAHQIGRGHAHVYINDVKYMRAYGPWVHLADLPSGEVVIKVTLNANDHSALAVNGVEIAASETVTIP